MSRSSSSTAQGLEILLIGHAGHPEVIGTMGQLPEGAVTLIETVADAERLVPRDPDKLAYVTPDHAFGRRHARDHRRAEGALPQYHRPAQE